MKLDPRTNAVRRDLADIRLADRVFAPHYAAPLAMIVTETVPLLVEPDDRAATVVALSEGTSFDMLEVNGRYAWGIAQGAGLGLVGYVVAGVLARG